MAQYKEIQTIEDWKKVFDSSSDRPLIIFKHSTTCPVSANAFNEFQKFLQNNVSPDVEYALIKVIESRPVSNQIAEDVSVKHESPQIILVKNKEKYWSASHWAITAEHMTAVLN